MKGYMREKTVILCIYCFFKSCDLYLMAKPGRVVARCYQVRDWNFKVHQNNAIRVLSRVQTRVLK